MKRRTLLQSLAAALFVRPTVTVTLPAQVAATLTDAQVATLHSLAEVVLPTAAGEAGRAAAVDRFVTWVRDYREGADRGHSYGSSVLSPATESGTRFWTTPQAKNTVEGYGGRHRCVRCNTCEVCPTGTRYSPDWTFKDLLAKTQIELHDQTLVRKLVLDERSTRVVAAEALRQDGNPESQESGSSRWWVPDGWRSRDQRHGQLRADARSRQPVRGRRTNPADRRLHQWDTDLRGAGAALR